MSIVLERSDVASFGAFLRNARERRGLTIQQIASETRIPWRHLDALEHGNLDAVPGGMYRRAEVRAYADAVGLDRGLALAQLEQVLDSQEVKTAPGPDPLIEPRERNLTAYAALALLAVVTLWAATRWQWQPVPQVFDQVNAATPAAASTGAASAIARGANAAPATTAPDAVPGAPPEPPLPAASGPAIAAAQDAAAEPPAAPDFALVVTSSPDGARVLVDGIGRGQTPVTIRHLSPGDRRLRVLLDGYVSHEQGVSIGGARAKTAVHVGLTPAN